MLFKNSKFKVLLCLILCNTFVLAEQFIATKSNMGYPDEIFSKQSALQDLSSSAVGSNLYFLPVPTGSLPNNEWSGTIHVNQSTGFSITEVKRGNSFAYIQLTNPKNEVYSIFNDTVYCNAKACPDGIGTFGTANVEITAGSVGSPDIRMVSINKSVDIVGAWQISISNILPDSNRTWMDFMVSYESSTDIAIHDSDQVSLSNQPNKFIIGFREPADELIYGPGFPTPGTLNGTNIVNLNSTVFVRNHAQLASTNQPGKSQSNVIISPSGEISTTIPALSPGAYTLQVDFTATMDDGQVIQRTGYYGFNVLTPIASLTGKATSRVVDQNRLEVSFDVKQNSKLSIKDSKVFLYAEIWANDKPVSYINTMTYIDQSKSKPKISATIDTRWFALAGAVNKQGFEFRNLKLMDPDTFLLLNEVKTLPVEVKHFPKAAYTKASKISIDDSMFEGKEDVYIPIQGGTNEASFKNTVDGGIFLVHGWCADNSAWNQNHFNNGPTFEYSHYDRSIGRDEFAIRIKNQAEAEFDNWFSIVAHSQGGQAAVHLKAYYFSGLDSSPATRPIQTVGTPFLGSSLMDLYYGLSSIPFVAPIIGLFNDCEAQFTLTTPGSYGWNIFLPASARNATSFHRTTHAIPSSFWNWWQFWRWKCNLLSYFIIGRDDGVTTPRAGAFLFGGGQNMGIKRRQCHNDMQYPDQKDDVNRNNLMDEDGRPPINNNQNTWTNWFDVDDPINDSDIVPEFKTITDHMLPGDLEKRSSHPGVCANAIYIDARVVGTYNDASTTGEVFSKFSVADGLVCINAQQPDNVCLDYEVRYFCP